VNHALPYKNTDMGRIFSALSPYDSAELMIGQKYKYNSSGGKFEKLFFFSYV
jgi:hypothetical protein